MVTREVEDLGEKNFPEKTEVPMVVEEHEMGERVGSIPEEGGDIEGEGRSMMDAGEVLPVRVIARARPLLPFETSQS